MITDAGPDSHLSNETVIEKGIIPIIAARANSVGNILNRKGNSLQRTIYPKNLPVNTCTWMVEISSNM